MTDSAKTKIFKILVGAMWGLIILLVSALYANMAKEIDKKASKDEVSALRLDIQEIKADTKLIIKMHLKNKIIEDEE